MPINHNHRYFGLNSLSLEAAVQEVQQRLGLSLGPSHSDKSSSAASMDATFYPQFSERIRTDAERMARNYILFYSLENAIRDLIDDVLFDAIGPDWWEEPDVVPEPVHKNADKNKKKEDGTGVTPRSDRMLDYTNFGELGEIIKSNWTNFGDIFRDRRAVERIIANLNTLRASIAHCTALSEDEELRLHLSLRDWFRQQA
ncbi:Swt1 family HEPN domain-containing protein [Hasllibacter sp. MH4015]|uniref:Swt1 family HEPN domain-containing protein n=1 Tax=Hasllibacter sp. MH4015 TaxID=2854029 RepID=UPI001CD2F0D4|nr:Swt1 family HEPN domain-containing protein [Hasllibacter sp. MH4015]